MKKYFYLSIFLFLFIVLTNIQAQENRWTWFAQSEKGDYLQVYYYDKTSISYWKDFSGNTYTELWIKITPISKDITHTVLKWRIYCKTKEILEVNYLDYYQNGYVYESEINYDKTSIVPETIGEDLYKVLCR